MFWIFIGVGAVAVLFLLLFAFAFMTRFHRKVEQGRALIINRTRAVEVNFRGGYVWPIFNKAEIMDISVKAIEIDRRGKGGLICKDNIRADITVSFYVRVNQTEEDVKKVASLVGCTRASARETLQELFNAKFSEALKTVGKQMMFEELFTERDVLKERILAVIGDDLNGYKLDDVAIDYLEQTPLESLDADNVLDSQGIRKIVDLTSEQKIQTNDRTRNAERVIRQQDVETREKILELDRQQADAEAKQQREILTIRAKEEAETRTVQEAERLRAQSAHINTEEKLRVAEENMERTHIAARKAKEQTEKVEEERVNRAQQLEIEERERQVAVKRIEKEKHIETEMVKIQETIRERVSLERTVAEEEEKIKDTRRLAEADRERKAQIIEAQREAEEGRVKTVEAARAKQEAAEKFYEEAVKLAEADKFTAEKEAEAGLIRAEKLAAGELLKAKNMAEGEKAMAEATRETAAAHGLAEVRVREAQANAIRMEGEAKAHADTEGHKAKAYGLETEGEASAKAAKAKYEVDAEGTRIAGAAEADAINAKADAMKNFDGVGREHEEFKLRLQKQERIEIAQIQTNQRIAEAQASVMAEAMKTAKIELVGGGGDFLETFFRSISLAKAVDGFVETSDVAKHLLSGESGLVDQVKALVAKEGLNTEDIKNMTVSAVLAKLALKGGSPETRKQASELKDKVKDLGLDELMALWLAK